ncbi:AaceriAFR029Cp [[Ashbya] aceris (nom. inval.)]|nr:AaceriAFR029Cp [[Ashbya] aceris (nom. inval.)]
MVSISGWLRCNCLSLTLFLTVLELALCAGGHEVFTSDGVVYRYHVKTTTVKPPVTIVRTVFYTAWASATAQEQNAQVTSSTEEPQVTSVSEEPQVTSVSEELGDAVSYGTSPSVSDIPAPSSSDPIIPTSTPGSCIVSYDDTEPFSTIYLTAGREDVGAYTTLTRTRKVIVSVALV